MWGCLLGGFSGEEETRRQIQALGEGPRRRMDRDRDSDRDRDRLLEQGGISIPSLYDCRGDEKKENENNLNSSHIVTYM